MDQKALTLQESTPQNGQTHSNNSSAITNCLIVFDHFVGLALKGLRNSKRQKKKIESH